MSTSIDCYVLSHVITFPRRITRCLIECGRVNKPSPLNSIQCDIINQHFSIHHRKIFNTTSKTSEDNIADHAGYVEQIIRLQGELGESRSIRKRPRLGFQGEDLMLSDIYQTKKNPLPFRCRLAEFLGAIFHPLRDTVIQSYTDCKKESIKLTWQSENHPTIHILQSVQTPPLLFSFQSSTATTTIPNTSSTIPCVPSSCLPISPV